MTSKAFVMYRT